MTSRNWWFIKSKHAMDATGGQACEVDMRLFRTKLDGPERYGIGDLEAHIFVEIHGAGVFLSDVKEGF
jgi:hypothetical protein